MTALEKKRKHFVAPAYFVLLANTMQFMVKMITMKRILTCIVIFFSCTVFGQDSAKVNSAVKLNGYVEAYYGYDFNNPLDNNRPAFIYNHNRHNEFNINLAYLKGSYDSDRIRASMALGAGTYMNANYAAEPGVLKNVFEAQVGVKISNKRNIWIDAGIMPSHLGFESAVSKACWTLTRSIMAESSPYYESGVRLSFTSDNEKWMMAAFALNGWQRIQRVPGNSLMSWGAQITFKASENTTLNYSSFYGTDKPDSARLWRYFHSTYGIFQLSKKLGLILGFDLGQEQVSKGSNELNLWFSPVSILRLTPWEDWAFALRGEYYQDRKGVIITTGTPNGFETYGASINIDRMIGSHFVWRTEIKTFKSKDAIFIKQNQATQNNIAFTTSFAVSF